MAEKQNIGRYKVVEKIGEGGMGKVFKAIHPTLKRPIIIKKLSIKSQKVHAQRFKREARIMIDFRNDNIVQVYDHFREGPAYYIAMEFVDGMTLEELVKKKKQICPMAAILILNEVCKGLKYAHDKGVVHRDVKPDNVLISKNGEVKLVDFGIATAREEDEEDITKTGAVMGTPAYMSPEQLSSAKTVDKRSDIYSVGVMFYKMITGIRPFPSNFTAEAIHSITKGIYERPEKLNPSIPAIFRKIIKRTMNHKVKRRYKDLKFLIKIFSNYLTRFKDQNRINQAIKSYISERKIAGIPELENIPIKKKGNPVILLLFTVFIVAGVGITGFFIYNKGIFHEIIDTKTYGSFEILVRLPDDYYKKSENVVATVYINSKDIKGKEKEKKSGFAGEYSLQVQPLSDLPFFQNREEENEVNNILTTNTIYLPSGNYTVHLLIDNQKFVKSFYLNPRAIQNQKLKTLSRHLIEFNVTNPASRFVSLTYKIIDNETGKSLNSISRIFLKTTDSWINWDEIEENDLAKYLKSGQNITIRYEAPGYFPKIIPFHIERIADSVNMEVELIRIPGKLILKSNEQNLKILIDNMEENFIGGEKKKFVQYGYTIKGDKEFELSEGNYALSIIKGNITQSYQFKILNNDTTVLKVTYNNDKNTLYINKVK